MMTRGATSVGVFLGALVVASAAFAAEPRVLEGSWSAAELAAVEIEAGVGEITIVASDDTEVVLEIELTARRGGLFSSMRRAEREVADAELAVEVIGETLRLEVVSDSEERRFEEEWTLELPARLAVRIDHGVGDVKVRDTVGGVFLEGGVGDVRIEVGGGDVTIDLGVGDVTVRGPSSMYGPVECSVGVGDADLRVDGDRIDDDGFIGRSVSARGSGSNTIIVEVGVGDCTVDLD